MESNSSFLDEEENDIFQFLFEDENNLTAEEREEYDPNLFTLYEGGNFLDDDLFNQVNEYGTLEHNTLDHDQIHQSYMHSYSEDNKEFMNSLFDEAINDKQTSSSSAVIHPMNKFEINTCSAKKFTKRPRVPDKIEEIIDHKQIPFSNIICFENNFIHLINKQNNIKNNNEQLQDREGNDRENTSKCEDIQRLFLDKDNCFLPYDYKNVKAENLFVYISNYIGSGSYGVVYRVKVAQFNPETKTFQNWKTYALKLSNLIRNSSVNDPRKERQITSLFHGRGFAPKVHCSNSNEYGTMNGFLTDEIEQTLQSYIENTIMKELYYINADTERLIDDYVEEISKILIDILVTLVNTKYVHGDLHFNNIYINKEQRNYGMIDFGFAGENQPFFHYIDLLKILQSIQEIINLLNNIDTPHMNQIVCYMINFISGLLKALKYKIRNTPALWDNYSKSLLKFKKGKDFNYVNDIYLFGYLSDDVKLNSFTNYDMLFKMNCADLQSFLNYFYYVKKYRVDNKI